MNLFTFAKGLPVILILFLSFTKSELLDHECKISSIFDRNQPVKDCPNNLADTIRTNEKIRSTRQIQERISPNVRSKTETTRVSNQRDLTRNVLERTTRNSRERSSIRIDSTPTRNTRASTTISPRIQRASERINNQRYTQNTRINLDQEHRNLRHRQNVRNFNGDQLRHRVDGFVRDERVVIRDRESTNKDNEYRTTISERRNLRERTDIRLENKRITRNIQRREVFRERSSTLDSRRMHQREPSRIINERNVYQDNNNSLNRFRLENRFMEQRASSNERRTSNFRNTRREIRNNEFREPQTNMRQNNKDNQRSRVNTRISQEIRKVNERFLIQRQQSNIENSRKFQNRQLSTDGLSDISRKRFIRTNTNRMSTRSTERNSEIVNRVADNFSSEQRKNERVVNNINRNSNRNTARIVNTVGARNSRNEIRLNNQELRTMQLNLPITTRSSRVEKSTRELLRESVGNRVEQRNNRLMRERSSYSGDKILERRYSSQNSMNIKRQMPSRDLEREVEDKINQVRQSLEDSSRIRKQNSRIRNSRRVLDRSTRRNIKPEDRRTDIRQDVREFRVAPLLSDNAKPNNEFEAKETPIGLQLIFGTLLVGQLLYSFSQGRKNGLFGAIREFKMKVI